MVDLIRSQNIPIPIRNYTNPGRGWNRSQDLITNTGKYTITHSGKKKSKGKTTNRIIFFNFLLILIDKFEFTCIFMITINWAPFYRNRHFESCGRSL